MDCGDDMVAKREPEFRLYERLMKIGLAKAFSSKPVSARIAHLGATSIGNISVGKLCDTWQDATSWALTQKRLSQLLDRGKSTLMILILAESLVSRIETSSESKCINICRWCEMTKATRSKKTICHVNTRQNNANIKTADLRPARSSSKFAMVSYGQKGRRINMTGHRSNTRHASSSDFSSYCMYQPLWTRARGDESKKKDNVVTNPPPVRPSEHERKALIRALFEWRDLDTQRDILLVGQSSDRNATIIDIERSPMLQAISDLGADFPPYGHQTESISVTEALLGTGHGELHIIHNANFCHQAASTQRANLSVSRDSIVLSCSHNFSMSRRNNSTSSRLILGPVVGVVSMSSASILIEVDTPMDVVVQVVPLQRNRADDAQDEILHDWLRPSLFLASSTVPARLVSSVPANRPVALRLVGLNADTRYRFALVVNPG